MNQTEEFFKNVGNKLLNVVTGPSEFLNSIASSFNNPIVIPMIIGLGGILAYKVLK